MLTRPERDEIYRRHRYLSDDLSHEICLLVHTCDELERERDMLAERLSHDRDLYHDSGLAYERGDGEGFLKWFREQLNPSSDGDVDMEEGSDATE